jgi:hypothetical protein
MFNEVGNILNKYKTNLNSRNSNTNYNLPVYDAVLTGNVTVSKPFPASFSRTVE